MDDYPLILVARVLLAAASGDQDRAKQTLKRLRELYPSYGQSFRRELGKLIPSTDIVDQLTRDLAIGGLNVEEPR